MFDKYEISVKVYSRRHTTITSEDALIVILLVLIHFPHKASKFSGMF